MSLKQIIISIFELFAVIFVLWGLFNDEKIAIWEERFFDKVKRNLKTIWEFFR